MKKKEIEYYSEIPDKIKVGGQKIEIIELMDDDILDEEDNTVGCVSLLNGFMKIDFNGSISYARNTFFHEVTHSILETMGEYNLAKNEKFVSCFSGFLNEAMEKAVFLEEREED